MSANTFGNIFRVTTFGESHGVALGAVVDGVPAGVNFDLGLIHQNLERRRPGQSKITSARNELDEVQVLSGVLDGVTLGTPVSMVVYNKNQKSSDYKKDEVVRRTGHATDLWEKKFGHSDIRGSGRASGRETLSRVLGGSVGQMVLKDIYPELKVVAFVSQVGSWKLKPPEILDIFQSIKKGSLSVDSFTTRIPEPMMDQKVQDELSQAKAKGESFGGMAEVFVTGIPSGLGQPVFKKLKSEFASAFMGIGTTQSFEIGFATSSQAMSGKEFHGSSDHYAGMRGGISTGESMHFRLGFKPPSTLGEMATSGRHDPCILPRVIPVLEAMAYLVLTDQVLWTRLDQLK